jgi:hypothetical protein
MGYIREGLPISGSPFDLPGRALSASHPPFPAPEAKILVTLTL